MAKLVDWQTRLAEHDQSLRIHLIGIGGAGLSAIAQVLIETGFTVSGSDRQHNANTEKLANQGITVFPNQTAKNINNLPNQPDLVLISSAIAADHPERQAAETLGIPVAKRDQFLPALLAKRSLIAISGTHGKSTTTAMTVKILREAGIDIGYIIGTSLPNYGNAAAAGSSPYFVIEADEYDHMFLGLQPTVSVINNVEWDHPDCFPTAQHFDDAFRQFAAKNAALTISCADDAGAEKIRNSITPQNPWRTYSVQDDVGQNADGGTCPERSRMGMAVDLTARVDSTNLGGKTCAALFNGFEHVADLELAVPGRHNLANALAAISVAQWCDVSVERACQSLRTFSGTARRFEIKGEAQGVTVIDDYAHHPTEVQVTLAGARAYYPGQRIWAVFQPHTFSRTKELQAKMSQSFDAADVVLVTDIYAAREQDTGEISAADIVRQSSHPSIRHTPTLADAANTLANEVASGDIVITLGAGDSYKIGEMLLERLS